MIVDDVVYFEEPFFQDGPVAVAVDKVAADGVAYFSAAGNNNLFYGEERNRLLGSAGFRDAGACPAGVAAGRLQPTTAWTSTPAARRPTPRFGIAVPAGATLNLDLQWAEPRFGVDTDLDAYLLDDDGNAR